MAEEHVVGIEVVQMLSFTATVTSCRDPDGPFGVSEIQVNALMLEFFVLRNCVEIFRLPSVSLTREANERVPCLPRVASRIEYRSFLIW
jgi:hypothetical protein